MADNTKKKQLQKQFNIFFIFSFLFTICFGIETLLVLFFILCDFFSLFNVSLFLNTIFKDKELFIVENLQNIQSIYTPFFVGFIATYFTVLSIFLGRKQKLGFKTCLNYMLEENLLKLNLIILLINFFLIEFSIPVFKYTPLIEFYAEDSILQLLWTFTICVYNLIYMEEPQKASILLHKYLHNEEKFNNCFNDFISRSFPKEKFEIYIDSFNQCKETERINLFLSLTKKIKNLDEAKAKDYEGLIDVLTNELYRLFAPNHLSEIDFKSVYALYEMLFSVILNSAYLKDTKKSYILKSREPLYFFIEYRRENGSIPKEVENLVNLMLDKYKQIIIVSLYHCNIEVVRQEINDFLGMTLPLQIKNFSSKSINKHTKYALDLITWIFNLLQFKKISVSYLTIISSILTSFDFSSIFIFDTDSELYDEGVNSGNIHTIIYNRNYYIAMLLLWCEVTKKYSAKQLIQKFRYGGISKNNSGFEYKNVLGGLQNIVKSDFISILPDYKTDFENAKIVVEQLLQEKIKIAEANQITLMRNQIDYKKVECLFTKQKQELLKEFDTLSDKTSSYVELRPIKVELCLTQKEIMADSATLVVRDNYYPIFFAEFFNRYINNSQLSKINIKKLYDLPYRENDTIIIPYKIYEILYKISKVQFISPSQISYDNRNFNIEFIHEDIDFIVLKSDFCKAFGKPRLNDVASKIEEKEIPNDILFKTSVDLIFSENMNIKFPVYKVEEFEISNSNGEE